MSTIVAASLVTVVVVVMVVLAMVVRDISLVVVAVVDTDGGAGATTRSKGHPRRRHRHRRLFVGFCCTISATRHAAAWAGRLLKDLLRSSPATKNTHLAEDSSIANPIEITRDPINPQRAFANDMTSAWVQVVHRSHRRQSSR